MTALTATAVITAVDRASSVFARVGASAKALSGRLAATTGGVAQFGTAAALNVGMPAALVGSIAARAEYEVDRNSRLMQSAGELTAQQRKMLVASAYETSVATGTAANEIVQAQRELIQGGFDPETAAQSSTLLAKVAKSNGMEMASVAEDAINVSNALGLAMDTTEHRVASMKKSMEFMSVVPSLSTESWEGLRTSLKYAAPVANALKISMVDLGAALSILADSGFKGEEGGTALRTALLRMVAPTRKARLELRAAGIDLKDMYKVDNAKLGNMGGLTERLLGAGLGDRKTIEGTLSKFKDPSKFDGIYEYNDEMMKELSAALGIDKGDAESRGILQTTITQHMFGAVEDFDMEKFFGAISKLGTQGMKELFGTQRISQAEALRKKVNEIMQLPTGERISRFRQLREEFLLLMPGSVDRRYEAIDDGYSQSIDKIGTALGNIRHQIFSSGFGDDLVRVFDRLSSSVNQLAQTDPTKLQAIGWGLTAIAATPALAFVTSQVGGLARALLGIQASEGVLATLMTGAGLKKGLLRGGAVGLAMYGAYEAYENWDRIKATIENPMQVSILWPELPAFLKFLGGVDKPANGVSGGLRSLLGDGLLGQGYDGVQDFYYRRAGRNEVGWEGLQPLGLIGGRGYLGQGNFSVSGEANLKIESKVVVVDGAGRVLGSTTDASRASVPLNTGKGMSDTTPNYEGYSP